MAAGAAMRRGAAEEDAVGKAGRFRSRRSASWPRRERLTPTWNRRSPHRSFAACALVAVLSAAAVLQTGCGAGAGAGDGAAPVEVEVPPGCQPLTARSCALPLPARVVELVVPGAASGLPL
jgi:hypothetical protein